MDEKVKDIPAHLLDKRYNTPVLKPTVLKKLNGGKEPLPKKSKSKNEQIDPRDKVK
jgi:hypothetical protein